jgi:hypothetical protein
LHSAIVAIIVATLVLSAGGFYLFSKKIWIWLKAILALPMPLWMTICLVMIFALAYTHLKTKKPFKYRNDQLIRKVVPFTIRFGVLWDRDLNMRCINVSVFS